MRILVGILAIVGLWGSGDAAGLVIDDFTVGAFLLGREGGIPPQTVAATQVDSTGSAILGGRRDVKLQKLSGSGTQPYVHGVAGVPGLVSYNSNFGCNAIWTVAYGAGRELGFDLTAEGGSAFEVELHSGDMWSGPRPTPLTIRVWSGSGSATVTQDLIAVGTYTYPFADFAGVDFSDVDRIEFEVVQQSESNDAIDFAFSCFRTNGDAPTPVDAESWGALKARFR